MKLLDAFKEQIAQMGPLKRVWLTTFNLDIAFVESRILPAVLDIDPPVGRMDYEGLQRALNESNIDFRVYCDPRMIALDKPKRTSIAVYPVSVRKLAVDEAFIWTGSVACFIPRCFTLKIRTRKLSSVPEARILRSAAGGGIRKPWTFGWFPAMRSISR